MTAPLETAMSIDLESAMQRMNSNIIIVSRYGEDANEHAEAAFMADLRLIVAAARERDGLREAASGLMRLLMPIHMTLAEREMVDDPVPDTTVILSFMGSGASDMVTAGDFRRATEAARQSLAPNAGEPK